MALDDQQLAIVLQASLDHARERLEEEGGFLPFGTRALPSGEIEFLEASGELNRPIEDVRHQIATMLGDDARRGVILGSALVANAALPETVGTSFENAVAVLIETTGFCRAIIAPYQIVGNGRPKVEFDEMIPEKADSIVFAE